MDDGERARLVKALEEFDPSDDYHNGERPRWDGNVAPGYYAAVDRAIELVRGNINTWTEGKP